MRKTILAVLVLGTALLAGCASSMMVQGTPAASQPDKALVTFVRPSYFGGAIQFGIWDKEQFVGILSAGSYVQYLTEPGEHLFLARAENWSYVKADLEGGKQYYIVGKIFPGIWKARVALDPVGAGASEQIDVDKWMKDLTPMVVIQEKYDDYVRPRVAQVQEAVKEFDQGNVKFGTLNKTDGR